MLFQAWTQKAHRPTRDLGLFGQGNPSPEHCEKVFRVVPGTDISIRRALSDAVRATFGRRRTQLDSDSLASLLAELADETSKRTQWRAFLRKSSLAAPDDFAVVNGVIREFLLWPMDAADSAREAPASWLPGGPWSYNLTGTTFAET